MCFYIKIDLDFLETENFKVFKSLLDILNFYFNTKSQHTMSSNQEKRLALHLQRRLFTVSASATYRTVAPESEVSRVKMVGKEKLEG